MSFLNWESFLIYFDILKQMLKLQISKVTET